MFDEELNVFADLLLKSIVGILLAFFFVASLFPSTGYVINHWVFLWYYVTAFCLLWDRRIDDDDFYFLRTVQYSMIVGMVLFAIFKIWWLGLIAFPVVYYINNRYPVKRSFMTTFLWGFWILHFVLIFHYKVDSKDSFLQAVTVESFYQTVLSWKIIIVVAFSYLCTFLFEEDDNIGKNNLLVKQREEEKFQFNKNKKERIQKEIEEAEKRLRLATDPQEKERLRDLIAKRKSSL